MSDKPKHKIGDYMRVYCGSYEGHCFYIKDVRYNSERKKYEYLYGMAGWYAENCIVPASSRKGWHYDSQGYCDNPGRGY
jgi:D-arabinose 1-dehydrogenase-like Zn-dependent alcohol dehydrogenase